LPLLMIYRLDFGIFLSVWYFLLFIILIDINVLFILIDINVTITTQYVLKVTPEISIV